MPILLILISLCNYGTVYYNLRSVEKEGVVQWDSGSDLDHEDTTPKIEASKGKGTIGASSSVTYNIKIEANNRSPLKAIQLGPSASKGIIFQIGTYPNHTVLLIEHECRDAEKAWVTNRCFIQKEG